MKLYIHRSGRTARAGQKGTSYSLVTPEEMGYIHDLSAFVGKKFVDKVEGGDVTGLICYGKIP